MTARDIGVAISLPEPYHADLQDWRQRLGDPNAANVPPHITLVPPTPLRSEELTGVVTHLKKVAEAEQAFHVHLRGTGTFRPVSPVVFVALAQGISDCERVQSAVRTGPLERTLAFPYHPHVTIAHDLPEPALDHAFDALADYEAEFDAWGFTLFERGSDGAWRPQLDFPFGFPIPIAEPLVWSDEEPSAG
jgi:2'-5' RNA ligase